MKENILKLRFKWFHLLAKDFIVRYQMGFLVLIMFLPGVAIGDNFNLFLIALTTPFQSISDSSTHFLLKIMWLFLLQVIFIVWARAQKQAINGGAFAVFQQSLPIAETDRNKANITLLAYANHLLWPIIIASYFYLNGAKELEFINVLLRNSFLVLMLLTVQYIFLFCLRPKALIIYLILSVLFLLNINPNYELIRLTILILFWLYLLLYMLHPKEKVLTTKVKQSFFTIGKLLPRFIRSNLHYQILFRSGMSSTLFRLATLLFLIIGFTLAQHHFAANNSQDLLPYAIALEALICFYISGFFVNFSDQRKLMHKLLISLPVKKFFWPVRDFFIVTLISLILHSVLFIWENQFFTHQTLLLLLIYQFVLLLICYPIRAFIKHKQTYFCFTILFIISAITIFNLS